MRLILLAALCWGVTFSEEIVSEGSQISYYNSDTDNHGDHGGHEFDEGGYGLQKHEQGSHGQSHHGGGEELSDHGQSHHSQYDLGSYGAQGSKGGHHGQNKNFHDKAFYSREKKHGYEKAYSYDKETKHHDKGGHSQSYGESHSQHSQHGQHKKGANGGQSHDHHEKKHHYGGQKHGQHSQSLGKDGYHKKGMDYYNRIYQKHANAGSPYYKYGGFSSGIGGPYKYYGYDGSERFPLWQKYYGNGQGGFKNGYLKYKNYDGDYDVDFDLDGSYKSYGESPLVGEPVGLSGLGGGLGPHGHYFIKRESRNYKS